MAEAKWYVVHTYSGYEKKVRDTILKTAANRGFSDQILDAVIPVEKTYEIKNGTKVAVEHTKMPGYVFVHMIHNNETWYIVRNTRGVTGFVGPGAEATPLTEREIADAGLENQDEEVVPQMIQLDYKVGDTVVILDGNWENMQAKVMQINEHKQTVIVSLEMFGRETPTELAFTSVKALN